MMLAPDGLGDRYHVSFYGDDIAWLWVKPEDGRLYGMNPEFGVFGVAKDTNESTNPTALKSVAEDTQVLFTNVAWNDDTHEVWWEGRTPAPPADSQGWHDWKGEKISDRSERDDSPWAHPNSRFTTTLANVPNVAEDFEDPAGRPDRRHHLRRPHLRPRAADPRHHRPRRGRLRRSHPRRRGHLRRRGQVEGLLRYDPMSMRPFMSYAEGDYAAHWLRIVGAATEQPIFAHVNWFQKDPEDGHFLWPGYRDNLRPLLWLMRLKDGEVTGRQTPVGIIPTEEELDARRLRRRPAGPGHAARHRRRPVARGDGLPRGPPASSSTASPRRSGRPTAGWRPPSTTPTAEGQR